MHLTSAVFQISNAEMPKARPKSIIDGEFLFLFFQFLGLTLQPPLSALQSRVVDWSFALMIPDK
jgi:hypothetical protein